MSSMLDIADLAAALVERAQARPVEKVAAAESELPAPEAVAELRKLAAMLRETPDSDVATLEHVTKIASALQPGTGAQAPGQGASMGANAAMPTLPSLKTTNTGITAGAGGAPPTLKAAECLRKVAADLRDQEQVALESATKTAHAVLRAAAGLHHLRQGIIR